MQPGAMLSVKWLKMHALAAPQVGNRHACDPRPGKLLPVYPTEAHHHVTQKSCQRWLSVGGSSYNRQLALLREMHGQQRPSNAACALLSVMLILQVININEWVGSTIACLDLQNPICRNLNVPGSASPHPRNAAFLASRQLCRRRVHPLPKHDKQPDRLRIRLACARASRLLSTTVNAPNTQGTSHNAHHHMYNQRLGGSDTSFLASYGVQCSFVSVGGL